MPIRKHRSEALNGYRFSMIMPDVTLVFRQVITVWNYDYIADIEIHQTGVISSSVCILYVYANQAFFVLSKIVLPHKSR